MGCYTVPLVAAITHYYMRKKNPSMNTRNHKMLNLLFAGGAIFGVVDHAWNGELLAFSWMDLGLGIVITISIISAWMIMMYYDKTTDKNKVTN